MGIYAHFTKNKNILPNKTWRSFILGVAIGFVCGSIITSLVMVEDQGLTPNFIKELDKIEPPPISIEANDQHEHVNEITEAQKLKEKVRIFCIVLTTEANHKKKAIHVKATWGRKCDKLLFISSINDPALPSVSLRVREGHDYLWGKTKAAFRYVYERYGNDYDWFLKADDDTYFIMENLRYMLSMYSKDYPIYFGCKFKPYVRKGYMSGGAGYVLSKEALKRFINYGLPNKNKCEEGAKEDEDVGMGSCLQNVGVMAGDSRDELGRGRFMPFTPIHHIVPNILKQQVWYWDYIYYNQTTGFECCSDTAISFHYVRPNQMYGFEYLIYHLKPYGINPSIQYPPALPPDHRSVPRDLLKARLGIS